VWGEKKQKLPRMGVARKGEDAHQGSRGRLSHANKGGSGKGGVYKKDRKITSEWEKKKSFNGLWGED